MEKKTLRQITNETLDMILKTEYIEAIYEICIDHSKCGLSSATISIRDIVKYAADKKAYVGESITNKQVSDCHIFEQGMKNELPKVLTPPIVDRVASILKRMDESIICVSLKGDDKIHITWNVDLSFLN